MHFDDKPLEVRMLIFAHDHAVNLDRARQTLQHLKDRIGTVKYHILFLRYHRVLLETARELELKIMADLKIWQPHGTARDLLNELRWLQVDSATIHLMGGSRMVKAVLDAVGDRMTIYGVTVPTDIDQRTLNEEMRIPGTILDQVLHLTELGLKWGLKNFVSSAKMAPGIRERFGRDAVLLSPGIRFHGNPTDMHDPKQVTTFYEAALHVDEIVSGTELLRGGVEAANRALEEIKRALADRPQLC